MGEQASHLLEVRDLHVEFHTSFGTIHAVDGISYYVDRGETLAILGESGSGKSVGAAAILNLIDTPPGYITDGQIYYHGRDLLKMSQEERREINGRQIAMIFQDTLAHLNPVYSVGWQVAETFRAHNQCTSSEADARALELLGRVGIPDPGLRAGQYPHQFSGGQRQRVMIAMALALEPDLLIADEPTTALDVTVQAQILDLLKRLQTEEGMGLVLITHDLGVAADMADRVAVMHAGKIVEQGPVGQIFRDPQHTYTRRLMTSIPGQGEDRDRPARGQPGVVNEAVGDFVAALVVVVAAASVGVTHAALLLALFRALALFAAALAFLAAAIRISRSEGSSSIAGADSRLVALTMPRWPNASANRSSSTLKPTKQFA